MHHSPPYLLQRQRQYMFGNTKSKSAAPTAPTAASASAATVKTVMKKAAAAAGSKAAIVDSVAGNQVSH